MKIKVNSEIGKLKKVLLHRPGNELLNLTPECLERLLFDDIPYLELAQKEHDEFSGILRANGVEVYYIENMVAEAIENPEAKEEFLTTFVNEAIDTNESIVNKEEAKRVLRKYLDSIKDNKQLVDLTIAGLRVSDLPEKVEVTDDYYFVADPLPNLYFQRDPFASIADGASINHMMSVTRNRETLYAYIMFKYHPEFKDSGVKFWYDRKDTTSIEGGDQLVINKHTLMIGISQRTQEESIEKLAKRIFADSDNEIDTIYGFDIGESRAYMHLDTVFTQVDKDKFSVHPDAINEGMRIKVYKKDGDAIKIEEKQNVKLEELLAEATGNDKVTLIPCGAGDPIASMREQWNDGANTLAIAPGEVVVYSRNPITNEELRKQGIKVHVMSSSELSRGRGGPRCMSMPLEREEL